MIHSRIIPGTTNWKGRGVLLFVLLSALPGLVSAQEQGRLWGSVRTPSSDTAILNWFPLSAEDWAATRTAGFRVERFKIDVEGRVPTPKTEADWAALTLENQSKLFPGTVGGFVEADSSAIYGVRDWGNGYPATITTMLYDSVFTDGIDVEGVRRQQHEMIALGAVHFPHEIGALLGMSMSDPGVDSTANYLYRITAIDDPTITQDILLFAGGAGLPRYRASVALKFQEHPFGYLLPPLPKIPPLHVEGKAFQDSLVIRWVPMASNLLRQSYKQGYYLRKSRRIANPGNLNRPFRYEIVADSIPVIPWSKDSLASYLSGNDDPNTGVLIAGQVLYGELQVTDGVSQAEVLQNQFAYGLQAADQYPLAAEAMGLRYVDYEVQPGEVYNYDLVMPIDSLQGYNQLASYNVSLENTYKGPAPISGFSAGEREYIIDLVLDRENEFNYNQFFFERSADGGNSWEGLGGGPIIFESSEELAEDIRYFIYSDSVSTLYQTFNYRVRGRNPFQEYSPWAELSAMARDFTPPSAPVPDKPVMLTVESVRLSWDGDNCETSTDFAGYYIKMGHTPSAENQPIVSGLIPRGTRTYDYLRPGQPFTNDSSYFFQVSAVDTAGNISSSFTVPLRVIDSIPPVAPVGLQARVDTNGVVTILWEANPEKDVAGYQVYFANDSTDVFSQITKKSLSYNYFKDTIVLNTLNEAIYYRVSAFDRSYNNSKFSAILRVERPDVVAPTPPLLELPKPTGEAVELTWRPSSSRDAEQYLILRRAQRGDDREWTIIDSISATAVMYIDTSAEFEVAYQYTMHTVDDAGLLSEQANVQVGRRIFTNAIGGVGEVSVALEGKGKAARTQVQWTFEKPTVELLRDADHRFMLYRAEGDATLTRYKQLKSKEPLYTDTTIEAGKSYRYAVMVVYSNGKKSGLSAIQGVTIPPADE